jgi:hypothetical protein
MGVASLTGRAGSEEEAVERALPIWPKAVDDSGEPVFEGSVAAQADKVRGFLRGYLGVFPENGF